MGLDSPGFTQFGPFLRLLTN